MGRQCWSLHSAAVCRIQLESSEVHTTATELRTGRVYVEYVQSTTALRLGACEMVVIERGRRCTSGLHCTTAKVNQKRGDQCCDIRLLTLRSSQQQDGGVFREASRDSQSATLTPRQHDMYILLAHTAETSHHRTSITAALQTWKTRQCKPCRRCCHTRCGCRVTPVFPFHSLHFSFILPLQKGHFSCTDPRLARTAFLHVRGMKISCRLHG
ncbi:uncharacterized protein IWZ02DRAFT_261089 [Phyllosticta citriasiana]|uniref:uncharacterized protein n=1 Tax=Phyllosticta citriasiana TaxID=595635 RepID=UPI0030FDAA30